ncbi:hypothetical protein TrLO_g14105 [Triparma laevis f. longispina]|uniref:Uncharacterized protein n=1 Tax=Triparma laevis f. longispina TaxID=1714387 RepID=A0A9W7AHJ3_9STRA|nr:hypothetical protein TrLO_g14105 [Triparma laevis f. longispina]
MIACCACGDRKSVSEFSRNQAFSKIKIEDEAADYNTETKKKKKKKKIEAEPQTLTAANLDLHNDETKDTPANSGDLKRRQFCCRSCVLPNVFFKKVPNSRGGRGLGHFCRTPTCANQINDVPIYPFTIRLFKRNHKSSKTRQANRAAVFQRTLPPMENEEEASERPYEPNSASNRTGADGGGFEDNRHNPYSHSEDSYDFCEDESSSSLATSTVGELTMYEVRRKWGRSRVGAQQAPCLYRFHEFVLRENRSDLVSHFWRRF